MYNVCDIIEMCVYNKHLTGWVTVQYHWILDSSGVFSSAIRTCTNSAQTLPIWTWILDSYPSSEVYIIIYTDAYTIRRIWWLLVLYSGCNEMCPAHV